MATVPFIRAWDLFLSLFIFVHLPVSLCPLLTPQVPSGLCFWHSVFLVFIAGPDCTIIVSLTYFLQCDVLQGHPYSPAAHVFMAWVISHCVFTDRQHFLYSCICWQRLVSKLWSLNNAAVDMGCRHRWDTLILFPFCYLSRRGLFDLWQICFHFMRILHMGFHNGYSNIL